MRFNKKTDYGIALTDTLKVTYYSKEFVPISEIAKKSRLPRAFAEKLARTLRLRKIVESQKGSAGGYRLIKNPTKLSLLDIIGAFEKTNITRGMMPIRPDYHCPVFRFCPPQKRFAEIDRKINEILKKAMFA